MMKRALSLSALCAPLLLAACIDSTTTVSVRKDGTGIITKTDFPDASVMAMMTGLAEQMAGEDAKPAEPGVEPVDVERHERAAQAMGTGVRFVSARAVTRADGAAGVEAVYSFEDIRQLSLGLMPENPMGDKLAGMMGATREKDEHPITFDFRPGSNPVLIVNLPRKEDAGPSEAPPATGGSEQPDAAGMNMLKQFFQGFRVRLMVDLLEGRIAKTNAAFVERVGGRDVVTLFDIDVGTIVSDDKYLQEFRDLDRITDMNVALDRMKRIPGLKIETAGRVEIAFR